MLRLPQMKCEACHKGAPKVTEEEIAKLMPQVPAWQITEENGIKRLERTFAFDDFVSALDFTNRVGAIAEEEGHHPVLITTWGKVTVLWWTHKIDGIHQNDFIMAAKTDALLG